MPRQALVDCLEQRLEPRDARWRQYTLRIFSHLLQEQARRTGLVELDAYGVEGSFVSLDYPRHVGIQHQRLPGELGRIALAHKLIEYG